MRRTIRERPQRGRAVIPGCSSAFIVRYLLFIIILLPSPLSCTRYVHLTPQRHGARHPDLSPSFATPRDRFCITILSRVPLVVCFFFFFSSFLWTQAPLRRGMVCLDVVPEQSSPVLLTVHCGPWLIVVFVLLNERKGRLWQITSRCTVATVTSTKGGVILPPQTLRKKNKKKRFNLPIVRCIMTFYPSPLRGTFIDTDTRLFDA